MRTRMVPVLLAVLIVPALAQSPTSPSRVREQTWAGLDVQPAGTAQIDIRAARLRSIHHDAEELATLNVSIHSELQELKRGMLPKDLARNLKKMEKLSKRLRQEVER